MDMSLPVFCLHQKKKKKSQPKFNATAELVSFPPVNNILTLACESYGTSLLSHGLEKKWGSFQTHDTVLTSWTYQVSLLAASGLMTCCIHSAHRSVIACPSSQQLLDFITIKKKKKTTQLHISLTLSMLFLITVQHLFMLYICPVQSLISCFFFQPSPNEGQ